MNAEDLATILLRHPDAIVTMAAHGHMPVDVAEAVLTSDAWGNPIIHLS